MLLEGLHIPVLTPFFPDGRLNLRKLEANVARYSLTPAAGMIVLGWTGEANLLSDAETREVLRAGIGAAAPEKVMLAGVSRESVRGTLELVEAAAALGYDAVLVGAPDFAGCGVRERRQFLTMVADRAPVPVVLTGDLPGDWIAELAAHGNVLGAMDAAYDARQMDSVVERTAGVRRTVAVTGVFAAVTRRMAVPETLVSAASLVAGTAVSVAAKAAVRTRTKVVGFQVMAGDASRLLTALQAGVAGVAPALAAAAPQACYEVYAAWKDGDAGLAEEKQVRLASAAAMERDFGVAGLKYGCDLNGYFGGAVRLPLLPLRGVDRAVIEGLMGELKS